MPTNEQTNRELKAAGIEQAIVEIGHRRVPVDPMLRAEVLKAAGYRSASKDTWDTVKRFLADRFPQA